jgi:anhydro-N-acetylmuramic acid kinase
MYNHCEIIGLMSGTSLDGLDVAYCVFDHAAGKWQYSIREAKTYEYPAELKVRLIAAETADARSLIELHAEFGLYCGLLVSLFMADTGLRPEFIASHGHTIFHRPDLGYTFQLGCGASIAAANGITTISDFRTADVALGGQGAPLVPVGDMLLFADHEMCLNIGGFANISYDLNGKRIAYDVCPANIILNKLAQEAGAAYDNEGNMAAGGQMIAGLLAELEELEYYAAPAPKSLGKEWLLNTMLPVIEKYRSFPLPDIMHTVTCHIAARIAHALHAYPAGKVLITGGGALNTYLVSLIRKQCDNRIIIPDLLTVQFKEALIFGFLGLLRLRGENNCLASVTGAKTDHCSGSIHLG